MWIIEKLVAIQRAQIDGPAKLVTEYRRDHAMGEHRTRSIAVRHLMVGLEPHLSGACDAFVQSHYKAYARNVRHYRVVRIKA